MRLLLLTVSFFIFLSCNDNSSELNSCDLTKEDVMGSISYPEGQFCYSFGTIDYNTQTYDFPTIRFSALGEEGPEIFIAFNVEDDIVYGNTYSDFVADGCRYVTFDGDNLIIQSGFVRIDGSNYPNPSIYKLYGAFEITVKAIDGSTFKVDGQFSLK